MPVRTTANNCFPSGTDEQILHHLSFVDWVIQNPTSAFLNRVSFDTMAPLGIYRDDYVVLDRVLPSVSGDIMIVRIGGTERMALLQMREGKRVLCDANARPLNISPRMVVTRVGVVRGVVRNYR